MTKHIHIHLPSKTKDAGNFKEGQHKRDNGGKFTAGGGNAEHHTKMAEAHADLVKEHVKNGNSDSPQVAAHLLASAEHRAAASKLKRANDPKESHLANTLVKGAHEHSVKAQQHAKLAEASAKAATASKEAKDVKGHGKAQALHTLASVAHASKGNAASEHHHDKQAAYHAGEQKRLTGAP